MSEAFSDERGGMKILLQGMLKLPGVKYVVSDNLLSTQAVKFYKKIVKDKSINKDIIKLDEEIVMSGKEFSAEEEKEIFSNPELKIAIS